MAASVRVAIETGTKRTFASAVDWPGWARSGRTEALALEALFGYESPYRSVALVAGQPFDEEMGDFPRASPPVVEVVARAEGNVTTDFGVPAVVLPRDHGPVGAAELDRGTMLLEASWARLAVEALRRRAQEAEIDPSTWPVRYALRRLAWHVLDHCWEIEDRGDLFFLPGAGGLRVRNAFPGGRGHT